MIRISDQPAHTQFPLGCEVVAESGSERKTDWVVLGFAVHSQDVLRLQIEVPGPPIVSFCVPFAA